MMLWRNCVAVVACWWMSLGGGGLARAQAPLAAGERAMEQAVEEARSSPPRLRALLVRMPKGADLHMHLSGAVYAETLLADARMDKMCIDPSALALVQSVGTTRGAPGSAAERGVCAPGMVSIEEAFEKQPLYDRLIDSFSMRSFVPSAGWSGHDQFFATFDRYDPTHTAGARHGGEWVDEVATRAAAQNEQYIEVMHTPDLGRAIALASGVQWPTAPAVQARYGQDVTGAETSELEAMRRAIVEQPGFATALAEDRAEFATALAERRRREQCGLAGAAPACTVDVRFLFQVLRANAPAVVFAQTVLAFEIAEREFKEKGAGAAVVGLNFVQPEDNRVAMVEYSRQMRMIGFLHGIYPDVHIALHAGELAEGLVEPRGLRFHIREAVETAHAERIGHGVDVMEEDGADALLRTMATKHVAVEMNLTSNDVILGVWGPSQPMHVYRGAGVPTVLSTDDEGVSRIDLTHEYVRAVVEQGLGYRELKEMARASIAHSFLPGKELWLEPDRYDRMVSPCAAEAQHAGTGRTAVPMGHDCGEFLRANPRAAASWELEERLRAFEAAALRDDAERAVPRAHLQH